MRDQVEAIIESRWFQNTVMTLILANAVILGLETSHSVMRHYDLILSTIDNFIIYCFVLEILLRIYAYRLDFFRRPWCCFDLVVVSLGIFPVTESVSAMRVLRLMRVFRLVSVTPAMRKVVETLLLSIPGIISVMGLMSLFFYVFAVIGTHFYGATYPELFGSLGASLLSLFRVMTLDNWATGIMLPVLKLHPYAWIYFVLFIAITAFTILNVFVAVIINAMRDVSSGLAARHRQQIRDEIVYQIAETEDRMLDELEQIKSVFNERFDESD